MAKRKTWRRRNGSGSVVDTKRTDIRCPFMVRVNDGTKKDEAGKVVPTRKLLGYYETRELAEIALENYLVHAREAGKTLEKSKANKRKIADIWELFIKEKEEKNLSDSRMKGYTYSWNQIPEDVRNMSFEQTNYETWKNVFDGIKVKRAEAIKDKTASEIKNMSEEEKKALLANIGYQTVKRTKGDMQSLYEFAEKYDITVPNYPKMYDLGPSPKKDQAVVFSKDQISKLWSIRNARQGNREAVFAVDTVLILIYCGVRIEELLSLKNKDVHLGDEWFEVVKSKTPAGFRRIPIHKAVMPIWQDYYDPENTYFLTMPGTNKKYVYANYRDSYWDRLRDELEWGKKMTPHNARKTFSSYMAYYELNPTCQKIILGHEGKLDLQEKVYSKVPTSKLIAEMAKIPKDYTKLVNLNDEIQL